VTRAILARLAGAAIVGGLALGVAAPGAGAAASVVISNADTTAAPQVTMTVAVPGTSPDEPLATSAFTVLETGQRRPATVVGLPSDPLQVILVMDTSGSMAGSALAGSKAAANTLLDRLPAGASVGVIGFGDRPYLASPFTKDRGLTRLAISALRATGETALNDAVVQAARSFTQPRRTMVVLTDGRATGGPNPLGRSRIAAAQLVAEGAAAVVVDCETSFLRLGLAGELASQLRAPCLRLEQLRADHLAQAVRGAA
jgi:Mg-chelatase subunit ChlD